MSKRSKNDFDDSPCPPPSADYLAADLIQAITFLSSKDNQTIDPQYSSEQQCAMTLSILLRHANEIYEIISGFLKEKNDGEMTSSDKHKSQDVPFI